MRLPRTETQKTVKAYTYNKSIDKDNPQVIYVIFDNYITEPGYCGNKLCNADITRYRTFTPQYKSGLTTIDNLNKNYTEIKAPTGKTAQQLQYLSNY